MDNEKQLQEFIADCPWLINVNYESIPQLPNKGQEYYLSGQRRIDLILRDKVNKIPIIVEFKFNNFSRENVGQLMEYKARIIDCLSNPDNLLQQEFKNYLSCPKLILIVETCDNYARIACNMVGIEIFEYKNISKMLADPIRVKSFKDFTESFKDNILPLKGDRNHDLEIRVYDIIKNVLREFDVGYAWQEPNWNNGFFIFNFVNTFINRWLFNSKPISIGIYEDIFSDKNDVCICYYSEYEIEFNTFREKILKLLSEEIKNNIKEEFYPETNEFYLTMRYNNKIFLEQTEIIFRNVLVPYLKVIE
jgi:hypothetical protein